MASTSPFWARINFRIEEKNRAIINKQKEEEAVCKSWNVDIWDAMWEQYKQTFPFKISRCYKQTYGKMWQDHADNIYNSKNYN